MRRLGDLHSIATYQRTTTFRIHEPIVMPGIFQTEAYIRRMLSFWYAFLNAPNDADATVAMKPNVPPSPSAQQTHRRRPRRTSPTHPTRHTRRTRRPAHPPAVADTPAVHIRRRHPGRRAAARHRHDRILDLRQQRRCLESPTAAIKVTRPQEIARYAAMFDQLHKEAIHGHDARQLVAKVLARL